MVTLRRVFLLTAALLLFAGCSGPASDLGAPRVTLTALPGSSLAGVSLADQGSQLHLEFADVAADGTFVRLELVDGRRLAGTQLWAEESYLGLAVPTETGAEVGVFSKALDEPISLVLPLTDTAESKLISVPPVGDYNVITDLTVTDLGTGHIELTWTQINTGDYNFDGLVGITDLTPIGQLLGTAYSREAPDAPSLRAYWVDGNGDGEISVSDITPIGQNFGAYIAGYVIKNGGEVIASSTPGEPTVLRSDGQLREGLPPTYSVILPGTPEDDWAVVAVDKEGIEGSGSGDIVGDISLRANLDFSGIDLFDLDGSNPGPFDPSKIGSRLIEPIEIVGVDRWEVPGLDVISRLSDSTISFLGVQRERTLYLDLYYLPAVNLITGEPRQATAVHSTQTVGTPETAVTSIPLYLPAQGTMDMNIGLVFSPNPEGGYFSELTVQSVIPGDDPATPEIEESYSQMTRSRLAYATGLVSNDTDLDGNYEDEAELLDSDLDGISDVRLAHDIDLGDGKHESCGEIKIEGTLVSFDEHAGRVTLSEAVITDGGEGEVPDPLLVLISEVTRFEEHVKTDEGVIRRDIDPGSLMPGDTIEVTMICLEEGGDPLPSKYWIEKLMRKLDERTQ